MKFIGDILIRYYGRWVGTFSKKVINSSTRLSTTCFHLIILFLIFARHISDIIRTEYPKLQLLRSFLMITTTSLFFTALIHVPLADAASIVLISPLIVTTLSMPILGRCFVTRPWLGVLIGLSGAVIVIKPTGNLPFGNLASASHGFLLRHLPTKHAFSCQSDPVITTLFYTAANGPCYLHSQCLLYGLNQQHTSGSFWLLPVHVVVWVTLP